jgi:hypothetical protein
MAHVMPLKRPDPVPRGAVAEHRLLVEAGAEQEDAIHGLRRELQLDDGAAVAGAHDRDLSHKVDASLGSGRSLDNVRVFCGTCGTG